MLTGFLPPPPPPPACPAAAQSPRPDPHRCDLHVRRSETPAPLPKAPEDANDRAAEGGSVMSWRTAARPHPV